MFQRTLQIFATFFRIGCFTFGGGYAMIPIIERNVVDRRQWMNHEEFLEMIAIAQSLPGPISVNSALYTGYRLAGFAGGVAATLGITIPSFCIILLIALAFSDAKGNPTIDHIFKGIRPVVVAIIAGPIARMVKLMKLKWPLVLLPIVAALAIWLVGTNPIWILLAAALGGIAYQIIKDRKEGQP